jgi:hypothetical protein
MVEASVNIFAKSRLCLTGYWFHLFLYNLRKQYNERKTLMKSQC